MVTSHGRAVLVCAAMLLVLSACAPPARTDAAPAAAATETAAPAEAAWRAATRIDLIPTPQSLVLPGGSRPVTDFRIVRPPGDPLADTAARELNARIRGLGGKPLPVVDRLPDGPAIVLAPCTHALAEPYRAALNVSPADPGPEGCAIAWTERGGRPLVLALGSDAAGTLYAAETLRSLVQPSDAGPVLLRAEVRDRPAFARRCLGFVGGKSFGDLAADADPAKARAAADRYAEAHRADLQWLARHKINWALVREGLIDRVARQPRRRRDLQARCIRAMTDLARTYNVHCRYIFSTNIKGDVPEGRWTACISTRGDTRRYCWTATETHETRATRFAEIARDTGLAGCILHPVDGGGFANPEQWSRRCDRCRRKYGDDHARAAGDLFLLYHDRLKAAAPDCLFEAVPYPYHYQWMVPGFAEAPAKFAADMPHKGWASGLDDKKTASACVARLQDLHRRLAERLPDDVLVTFREGGPEAHRGCADLWPNHPIDLWVYVGRFGSGCRGLWPPQRRLVCTWHRPGRKDMLFDVLACFGGPLEKAQGAEYAWNVTVPDAEPAFRLAQRFHAVGGRNLPAYQRDSLLPRALRRLWGEDGLAFRAIFAANVSWRYVADPVDIAGGSDSERLSDPYAFFDEHAEALAAAAGPIDDLIARLERGEARGTAGDLRREYGFGHALDLYVRTNMAAARTRIGAACHAAEKARSKADRAEAADRLRRLLADLPAMADRLKDVRRRYQALAGRPPRGSMTDYDPAAEKGRIEKALRRVAGG